jgi:hypothetical protein
MGSVVVDGLADDELTQEQAIKSDTCEPLQEPKFNEWKGMSVQNGWKLNHHTDEAHVAASEGLASDYIDNGPNGSSQRAGNEVVNENSPLQQVYN